MKVPDVIIYSLDELQRKMNARYHAHPEAIVYELFRVLKEAFKSSAEMSEFKIDPVGLNYYFQIRNADPYFKVLVKQIFGSNGATISEEPSDDVVFTYPFGKLSGPSKQKRLSAIADVLKNPTPEVTNSIEAILKITENVPFSSPSVGPGINFSRGGHSYSLMIEPTVYLHKKELRLGVDLKGTNSLMRAITYLGEVDWRPGNDGLHTATPEALTKVAEFLTGPRSEFEKIMKQSTNHGWVR